MPANAAIYLPVESPDLALVFPNAKSDGSLFRKASYFNVDLDKDVVRFNLMPPSKIPIHLLGFLNYIRSLKEEAKSKSDAAAAIGNTKSVLGLVTDKEFEENSAIWQALFKVADAFDGYVFVHDSVLLANETALVGPLANS